MKKLLSIAALALAFGFTSVKAENYKINDQQIDQLFASSTDETSSIMAEEFAPLSVTNVTENKEMSERAGYLVRAFFCGGIALHRYFMGSSGKPFWAMYLCIPVAGGVAACVDFWWVVIDADALSKYKGNNKFLVFLDSE